MTVARPFLTAEWRHVAILSFEVDPAMLLPLLPGGTELDAWHGRTLASVVGLLFQRTRVLGVPIPFHREFEEVNLRFYVRRRTSAGWRRGVVFVKELVPRAAVALTARALYGENYAALPMTHRIDLAPEGGALRRVSYSWRLRGRENRLVMDVSGPPREIEAESEEEFVAEHHWGYVRKRSRTLEYRVDHPPWHVWKADDVRFDCDAESLYGSGLAECLRTPPASAYLADGSGVAVHRGVQLPSS